MAQAEVTRGALYHHFADKRDLFRAVFETVEAEVLDRIVGEVEQSLSERRLGQPAPVEDGWEELRSGLQGFLAAAAVDPESQRIILVDGPAVLGWEASRQLLDRDVLALLEVAIDNAIGQGMIAPQPASPLAHMLLGAVSEAALLVANSADPEATRQDVSTALDRVLAGLRLPRSS